jgi:hypothetical protein
MCFLAAIISSAVFVHLTLSLSSGAPVKISTTLNGGRRVIRRLK